MNDDQIDALLAALSLEGFSLPHSAHVRDYMPEERFYGVDSPEFAALRAADAVAWQLNRIAIRNALSAIGVTA